ncbi:hypothetical protein [Hymenobacter properus]|uniref:Uncharacterized protein n=1 Tax=Hymenobacter properus TaxID=2791026 RepID=A0A931BK89_9BACT|nr:hypothetical protein [Hymenobacter properus]MBF9144096.1 hypothetical protein [Hymenobacter properus]MBR7722912.1 hypothetical protein [Microvirga sp. SRT04]
MNTLTAGWGRRGSLVLLLGALLGAGTASAQIKPIHRTTETSGQEAAYATQKHLTVAVTKFAEARAAVSGFIRQRAVHVQKQEETPEQLIAEFALASPDLVRLDSLTAALGNVLENNLNSQDLSGHIGELEAEALRAADQVAAMEPRRSLGSPDEQANLRRDLDRATQRLTDLRQQLAGIAGHAGQAYVTLRLFDEVSFPTGNRRVSFVNMPGVEYGYLRLDNPKVGLTSTAYQGYALKYLVTRGKSYFNLGFYRPVSGNTGESDFVNELFVINFGQDFYPRNFGRGRRRYFNLYTCYQLGGFILNRNSDKGNEFVPNANIGIGLEIMKTRHVLIDTKASYFVPLNDRSRDLRGVLGQAAFNFVF